MVLKLAGIDPGSVTKAVPEVSVAVANQNDFESTFSIGISSTPGFKSSDYIAYGIPLDRGGTRLIEKVDRKVTAA